MAVGILLVALEEPLAAVDAWDECPPRLEVDVLARIVSGGGALDEEAV